MIRVEHNVETGEILEIELSSQEIEQLEIDQAAQETKAAEAQAKATARAAILDRLGLTAEEAAILLG